MLGCPIQNGTAVRYLECSNLEYHKALACKNKSKSMILHAGKQYGWVQNIFHSPILLLNLTRAIQRLFLRQPLIKRVSRGLKFRCIHAGGINKMVITEVNSEVNMCVRWCICWSIHVHVHGTDIVQRWLNTCAKCLNV